MRKYLLGLICVFSVRNTTLAQTFESALEAYTAALPENIYLQYDQEYYVPGETIWFKAYLYKDGKPVTYNRNLYVQLLGSDGKAVVNQLYPVIGAVAAGSIPLSETLVDGVYYLRALTDPMLPSGSGAFLRPVSVSRTSPKSSSTLKVDFYPESGQLVGGMLSRIAFKGFSEDGFPVPVKGALKDSDGKILLQVSSYHKGQGVFEFRPQLGKKYELEVIHNGEKKTFILPAVRQSGINLRVDDERDGKTFLLSRISEAGEHDIVYLVAQLNGHVVYEEKIEFEDYPSVKGHLVTRDLPSGVLQFVLFDKDRQQLAERLSFVHNSEYLSTVSIEMDKMSGKPRSLQEISLKLDGGTDKSLSVYVIQGITPATENIITYKLLSSFLTSTVSDPAWYFRTSADSSRMGLDILMMTQQLRQFQWSEVLSFATSGTGEWPDFLEISGKVLDDKKNEAMGPGQLNFYIEAEDSSTINYQALVKDDGTFEFDSILFAGNAKLFYAFTDKNSRQRSVRLVANDNDPFHKLDKLSMQPYERVNFGGISSAELSQRLAQVGHHEEEIKVLERVTLNVKKKRPTEEVEERYTTGVFRLPAGKTLDNINDPVRDKTMNVVDYIRNRINDVELAGRGFVNRKTLSMGSNTRWVVGVFLDEVPTELSILRSVTMGDVALVKFYDAGWVGVGSTYPGGALAIYTKKNSENSIRPDRLPYIQAQGYTLGKPFLHRDYGKKDIRHAPVDHRYTLYWNPDVVLKAGTTNFDFRFYGNDLSRPVRIIVEGIDADGKLVYGEKVITY